MHVTLANHPLMSVPERMTVPLLRMRKSLSCFKVVFWSYSKFAQCVAVRLRLASNKYRPPLSLYSSGAWTLFANFKELGSMSHLSGACQFAIC